jgi:ABC-type multidrug transport system fused ATPase/permease subunit
VRHLDALNARRRRAALQDTIFGELVRSFGDSMGMVGIGVVLLLGASTLRDGTVTVGDMALFMTYVPTVAGFAGWLGRIITEQRRMGVSVERMQWLLRGAPRTMLVGHDRVAFDAAAVRDDADEVAVGNHGPAWPEGDRLDTLEVGGLRAHHLSTGRGIDDATFALRCGTVTVVAGRVGSGKTTLLRAVLGLMPRLAGKVRWNGATVAHLDRVMVPPRSAYVPQVPRLFSETLRENIRLRATFGDEVLGAALRDAMLDADVETLDRGLDTLVGPRGVRLSGG